MSLAALQADLDALQTERQEAIGVLTERDEAKQRLKDANERIESKLASIRTIEATRANARRIAREAYDSARARALVLLPEFIEAMEAASGARNTLDYIAGDERPPRISATGEIPRALLLRWREVTSRGFNW